MPKNAEQVCNVLRDLGLAPTQARVYLTLCQTGDSTVKQISKASGIARQDVYRVVCHLIELGLVETIINLPTKFKVVSPEKGLSFLLQRKQVQLETLSEKTRMILPNLKNQMPEKHQEPNGKIALIPMSTWTNTFDGCQTSLDWIGCSYLGFVQSSFKYFDNFKGALLRGVKIRGVVGKPENGKKLPREVLKLMKIGNYEIRYSPAPVSVASAIFDKRRVLVASHPIDAQPVFCTNDSRLIPIFNAYFEMTWHTALEEIPESP